MKQVIVFGGLSAYGFPISEALAEKGNTVISISSALNSKEKAEEDERALFLGRNALFRTVDHPKNPIREAFCIADSFRRDESANRQLKAKLKPMLDAVAGSSKEPAIFLSTLEVYDPNSVYRGEKRVVRPITDAGKRAAQMEQFFCSACRDRARNKAAIFRTDLSQMKTRGSHTALLMAELIAAPFIGLQIFNYDGGSKSGEGCNQKLKDLFHEKFDWL
ncbi:NAD(P)-dependent oxidoreductase [Sporolactobacillus shoreae]|uniref:NAD(P)-dependent oxidoreductase n=1 Tax=Sporolactobacillus shoreae TaxID=1465501 RepID=A0A4Z0GML2_9BACL|nr:NAD(P)-dependent oxidoreductase [Sporolactobacillus shoreae]TGA97106.1 NAD(P)-dependent oxidoreductase [Sporolactobacillus shoreae]